MSNTTRTLKRILTISAMAMAIPVGAYAATTPSTTTPKDESLVNKRSMHHEGMDSHEYGMKMFDELNLSEAQKKQVQQIVDGQKQQMKSHWEESRAQRTQLDALVESETFDKAKADALIQQHQTKERAARLSMLESRHQIYKILTPEQREKARQLRAKHEQKRSEKK